MPDFVQQVSYDRRTAMRCKEEALTLFPMAQENIAVGMIVTFSGTVLSSVGSLIALSS